MGCSWEDSFDIDVLTAVSGGKHLTLNRWLASHGLVPIVTVTRDPTPRKTIEGYSTPLGGPNLLFHDDFVFCLARPDSLSMNDGVLQKQKTRREGKCMPPWGDGAVRTIAAMRTELDAIDIFDSSKRNRDNSKWKEYTTSV